MTTRAPRDDGTSATRPWSNSDDASYAKTAIALGQTTRTDARSGVTGYAPTVTPDTLDPTVEAAALKLEEGGFALRYGQRELLGEGGMGEVRLYEDARIGRDVAMKVIRPGHGSRSDLRSRFLREARVQGQLEHPAIVPVYDLGVNPDGAAYFTMKRVRGMTLEEVIDGLRKNDPETLAKHSRRKLLTAFGSVCLAVDFAHARGVIHRDLKPGNVMLGGFGEVYVLDWGVAKLGNVPDPEAALGVQAVSDLGATGVGAVLGTPGHAAGADAEPRSRRALRRVCPRRRPLRDPDARAAAWKDEPRGGHRLHADGRRCAGASKACPPSWWRSARKLQRPRRATASPPRARCTRRWSAFSTGIAISSSAG